MASLPMALSASECFVPRRQALRLAIVLVRARVASLGVWSLAVLQAGMVVYGRSGVVLLNSLSSVFPARSLGSQIFLEAAGLLLRSVLLCFCVWIHLLSQVNHLT